MCLELELTNTCNLKCLMCPTGTGVSIRERGFFDDELYNKILAEVKGMKMGIRFIRWGEPMLHPRLIDYIAQAKADGHLVHMNTNATMLDEIMIKKLLDAGLDSIKFSFQGVDAKSYGEMRQGANFKQVVSNIAKMYGMRGNSLTPYMHISTTTTYENETDIAKFKTEMAKICDFITVGQTLLDYIDTEKTRLDASLKQKLTELKTKQQITRARFVNPPCLAGEFCVNWNGICSCNFDYDYNHVIGDLREQTIREIYNGEKMHEHFVQVRDGIEKIPYCSIRCWDYMNLQAS